MSDRTELEDLRRLDELEKKAAGAKPAAVEPSFLDKVAEYTPDFVKNIGSAAYKGVASLGAGAMDALAGSHDITDYVMAQAKGQPLRELDTSMPNSRALEASGYQPKTATEKYIASGVKGASAALLNPGATLTAPVRAAFTGGLAGLGSEAGGQLFKGTKLEGPARVVGGVAGGGLGGLASSPLKNSKDLAAEMLTGTNPQDIEIAKALMAQSKVAGVPLNLDQAMGTDTNITNVVKALVGRKEGQAVVDQLRDQPNQVGALAQRLTRLLPGEVKAPAAVANETQSAATSVLAKARADRTAATRPLFDQSGVVPPQTVDGMAKGIRTAAAAAPDTNKGALLNDLADVLEGATKRAAGAPTGLLDASGNPIISAAKPIDIQELNGSLRTLLTNAKSVNSNSKAGDLESVGALRDAIKQVRDQLGAVSPKFKQANDLYAQISADVVDPLKKSVVGRVAGATGELADKEAVNKILPLLAKGRDPNSKTSEITQFAEATKGQPEVFQNAVKTNFSNAVAAAEAQVNGKLAPSLPAAMERTLLGDASKRQGMKDQLEAIAVHNGQSKDAIYPGFMAALKIISAAAKRPEGLGPDTGALNAIAGQSVAAQGLKMVGLAPGKPAGQALQNWLTGDAYRTLAENLTTPEGVAKLQALAKMPIMSTKAQALVSTMLATGANDDTPPGVRNITPGDDPGDHEFR